jgi:hypothetical protein
MTSNRRRFLGFLSAFGIAACIFLYSESFFGATTDSRLKMVVPIFIGVFAAGIPIYTLEYPSSNGRMFYWKWLERSLPKWVTPFNYLLALVVIAHFVALLLQTGTGAPAIKDGQYVLDSHGRVLKVLTQPEYLALKEAELRVFTTMMISGYFMPMMYWLRGSQQHPDCDAGSLK